LSEKELIRGIVDIFRKIVYDKFLNTQNQISEYQLKSEEVLLLNRRELLLIGEYFDEGSKP